ncbi:MAG: hypothetical protein WCI87_08215 [Euryarchaeota archaeon]
MNLKQFQSQLRKLGVNIPQGTLKRWAYDGLIPRPKRYKKGRGGGRGRAASWDRAAIAEVAALWAIRNAGGHKLLQSKKRIDVIRHAADYLFRGERSLMFDPIILLTDPNATWQSVKVRYINENFPASDLELFPGKNLTEQSDALNTLVVAWICAKEKARRKKSMLQPARVVMHWRAVVDETTSGVVSEGTHVLEKTTLEAADCDELIYCENGVDLRELFERRLILRHPKHLAFRAEARQRSLDN